MSNLHNSVLAEDAVELAQEVGGRWPDEVAKVLNAEHVDMDYLYWLYASMRLIREYQNERMI